jgi:hypothetical protein
MTTRTIVTSQPDVACDVCERRLLRGEQPDVFIAAGRRLTVCELCAPRAAHEGWTREGEERSLALPPARGRRGRGLLERLRQVGRPAFEDADEHALEGHDRGATPVAASRRRAVWGAEPDDPRDWAQPAEGRAGVAAAAAAPFELADPSYEEQAVMVFNVSEFPRRVAGVARSLGAPEVSVSSAEHLASVVRILVAWELSWYRYEVDLSDPPAEARVIGQGTELSELAHDERLSNAVADDGGRLALAA